MGLLLRLLVNLPWWGGLAVIAGLVLLVIGLGYYIRWKFHKICYDAVLGAGAALDRAEVTVHEVRAVAPPTEPSPYDIKEDDEEFMDGVDNAPWDADGDVNYYSIEVTIAPAFENQEWDPTGLALVPADHSPDDPIDISEQLCPLHSAELFVNGQYRPAAEGNVRGAQRVRFLFAVHDGLTAVKFAQVVTYFGRVDLPAPLPRPRKTAGRR